MLENFSTIVPETIRNRLRLITERDPALEHAVVHWKRLWFAIKALWAVLHVRGMTYSKSDFGHASCSNLAL